MPVLRRRLQSLDAILDVLVHERHVLCQAIARGYGDHMRLTRRLLDNCEAIAYTKHERDELVSDYSWLCPRRKGRRVSS